MVHGVAKSWTRLSDFTFTSLFTFMHWRRKWQPTPVFLPGESQGWGSLGAAIYGVPQSQTRLKRLSSKSSSRINSLIVLALVVSAPNPKAQGLISGQEQRFHKWFVMALSEIKTNIQKQETKDDPRQSDQIRSIAQLCPTLCDPMIRSTPGLPVNTSPTPRVHWDSHT